MKIFKAIVLSAAFILVASPALMAEDKLKIVTTLSTYADIAKSVGGDLVEVSYVASPKFDPHFIEPKPSDVLKVKKADLFIHSGLDLEAWREPLIDAAARGDLRGGGKGQLDLSLHIPILGVPTHHITRADGDIHVFGNPHYWLDPRNGLTIADDIATKLSELDAAHALVFEGNAGIFKKELGEKIASWQNAIAQYRGTKLVGYHDGWLYLMNFVGMEMEMFLEPKPGIPPAPKQMENVVSFIRRNKVRAVILSPYNSTDAAEAVSRDTGVKILTLSPAVGDMKQSSDYISMLDYNIGQLMEALGYHE